MCLGSAGPRPPVLRFGCCCSAHADAYDLDVPAVSAEDRLAPYLQMKLSKGKVPSTARSTKSQEERDAEKTRGSAPRTVISS